MSSIAIFRSYEPYSFQMVIGGALLGTIGIFVVNAGQDPLTTVFFRCFFGCLALGLWMYCSGQLSEIKVSPRGFLVVSATGTLMATIWGIYFLSLNYISVGLSTLVYHLQPFWLVFLTAVLFRETITRNTIAVLLVAIVGLGLASGVFNGTDLAVNEDLFWGVGLCLFGSVLFAVATLIAKNNSESTPIALAWWQCFIGACVTVWSISAETIMTFNYEWVWLIGLGVIHSGVAFTLIYNGISGLATSRIAILQFVYPGTALLVDWLYFDHTFTLIQWMGAGLLGMALWSLKR